MKGSGWYSYPEGRGVEGGGAGMRKFVPVRLLFAYGCFYDVQLSS